MNHSGDFPTPLATPGADDPAMLAARTERARVFAALHEGERALVLHEQVVAACERALGADHPVTLDCREDLAHSLVGRREYERARIVYERVLDARRARQGSEHGDTLRCGQRLALLLGETGELGSARRLLEAVLRAYGRRDGRDGPDDAGTVAAREALAAILAVQGEQVIGLRQHVRQAEGSAGSHPAPNPVPLR